MINLLISTSTGTETALRLSSYYCLYNFSHTTPPFLNGQFNSNWSSSPPNLDHGVGTKETPLVVLRNTRRYYYQILLEYDPAALCNSIKPMTLVNLEWVGQTSKLKKKEDRVPVLIVGESPVDGGELVLEEGPGQVRAEGPQLHHVAPLQLAQQLGVALPSTYCTLHSMSSIKKIQLSRTNLRFWYRCSWVPACRKEGGSPGSKRGCPPIHLIRN